MGNSIETLTVKGGQDKQTSIILNASSNTIHTLNLNSVTLYPALVQNVLNNLQHLSLQNMKSDDFLILLNRCTKSFTDLSLNTVSLDDDTGFEKLETLITNLETLIIKWSQKLAQKLPSLLTKCSSTLKSLNLKSTGSFTYKSLTSLDVEMCSLEKIVINVMTVGDDLNGLINLLNRSPNLQYLELDNVQCSTDYVEILREMKIKHLKIAPPYFSTSSIAFEHQLLLACSNTLEYLDQTFFDIDNSRRLFLDPDIEWFLPELKVMKLRGSIHKAMKDRRNLVHHIPPQAKIEYYSSSQ